MSNALANSFREWNKMLIDQQQWNVKHEEIRAKKERDHEIGLIQAQDAAQNRKIKEYQVAQAEEQMTVAPITMDGLGYGKVPGLDSFFMDSASNNQIARGFSGDPNSRFDTDPDSKTYGHLLTGNGTVFQQEKFKNVPGAIAYQQMIGSELRPDIVNDLHVNNLMQEELRLKENLKAVKGDHWTRKHMYGRVKSDLDQVTAQRTKLENRGKNKGWRSNALQEHKATINDAYSLSIQMGVDPTEAGRIRDKAMDSVAHEINNLNASPKNHTEKMKMYDSYLESYTLANGTSEGAMPFHTWDIDHSRAKQSGLSFDDWKTARRQELNGLYQQEISRASTQQEAAQITQNYRVLAAEANLMREFKNLGDAGQNPLTETSLMVTSGKIVDSLYNLDLISYGYGAESVAITARDQGDDRFANVARIGGQLRRLDKEIASPAWRKQFRGPKGQEKERKAIQKRLEKILPSGVKIQDTPTRVAPQVSSGTAQQNLNTLESKYPAASLPDGKTAANGKYIVRNGRWELNQ